MTLKGMAQIIDHVTTAVGKSVAWLTLAMVLMMCSNVLRRYLFAAGMPWEAEIITYMNSMVFLLGAGYAYRLNAHVRVDVFREKFSSKTAHMMELLGILCFLWPMCAVIGWASTGFIVQSWGLREGSPEYLGMPGVFLLKSLIWAYAGLLALQGLAEFLRHYDGWRRGEATHG